MNSKSNQEEIFFRVCSGNKEENQICIGHKSRLMFLKVPNYELNFFFDGGKLNPRSINLRIKSNRYLFHENIHKYFRDTSR